MLFIFLLLFVSQCQVFYDHDGITYRKQQWMTPINDHIPLRQLSILGTHASMSFRSYGDSYQTQGLSSTLQNQLLSGIRAIDLCCRHQFDSLPVYFHSKYLDSDLDGVLNVVKTFLTTYPGQSVLIVLNQQGNPNNNTRTFEQTFSTIIAPFSSSIWTPNTTDPKLGMIRGKIVFIQNFTGATYGLSYSSFTTLQHKLYANNFEQHSKWQSVKQFIIDTNFPLTSRISYWTGSQGSYPYFCASGKNSPPNSSPRLSTGLTTPGFATSYPDFPRTACFLSMCTIVFQGINILGSNYYINNNIKNKGIVFVDFPGVDLIKLFVDGYVGYNATCSALQTSRGCLLCSNTDVCLSCDSSANYVLYIGLNFCSAAPGYFLNPSNIPTLCSSAQPGCIYCESSTNCTDCNETLNYNLTNGQCEAADGYYLDSNSTAVKCMIGCIKCTSSNICISCSSRQGFSLSLLNICECKSGFNLNTNLSKCLVNCSEITFSTGQDLSSSNNTQCQCQSGYYWNFSSLSCLINCSQISYSIGQDTNNTCLCLNNFIWNSIAQLCQINCLLFNNTITSNLTNNLTNIDYCICQDGFAWDLTSNNCQLVQNVTNTQIFQVQQAHFINDDACSNKIVCQIKLDTKYNVCNYGKLSFVYYKISDNEMKINQDLQIQQVQANVAQNQLKITLKIKSDLQNQSFHIGLTNQYQSDSTLLIPVQMASLVIPALYSEQECLRNNNIKILVLFCLISSCVTLFIGMASASFKMIGLQLFGLLQICYFSLSQHDKNMNIYIFSLKTTKFSNGFSFNLFSQFIADKIPPFLRSQLQNRILLINNVNLLFLIYLLLLFILILAHLFHIICKKYTQNNYSLQCTTEPYQNHMQTLKQIPSSRPSLLTTILKQLSITFFFFMTTSFTFYSTIFFKYNSQRNSNQTQTQAYTLSYVTFVLYCLINAILMFDFVKTDTDADAYGQFKQLFKYNYVCRMYLPIIFVYRVTVAAIMACSMENGYDFLFAIFVSIGFVMFNLINLPYRSTLHNYRSNIVYLSECVVLITANYYRTMKSNTPLPVKAHLHHPALLLYVFLTLSVVFSIILTFYEIFMKVKLYLQRSRKINNSNRRISDQKKSTDQQPSIDPRNDLSQNKLTQ